MKFTESRLPGAWIIDVTPIHDDRGLFAMTWRPDEFREHGCKVKIEAKRDEYKKEIKCDGDD